MSIPDLNDLNKTEGKRDATGACPELDSANSVAAGSSQALPGRPAKRRQRLGEYRRQALAHPDSLQANLGATNADLMEIANGLGKIIRSAIRGSVNPSPDLLKVLQTYHNCARLVQRFTMFDERFRPAPPKADVVPNAIRAELSEGADDEKQADSENS